MKQVKEKSIIGPGEFIDLPELGYLAIPSKTDTGADLNSIWSSDIKELDGKLHFKLFDRTSTFYDGREIIISKPDYAKTRVANSFGHREWRYVVKLRIVVAGRVIRTRFSLSDRSNKLYPILLGTSLLRGKFLVDVSKPRPLRSAELRRKKLLAEEIAKQEATNQDGSK